MHSEGTADLESSSACLTNIETCVAFRSSKPIGLGGSFVPSNGSQLDHEQTQLRQTL